MKKIATYIILAALTGFFAVLILFIAEKTDVLQIKNSPIEVTFAQEGDDMLMTWHPFKYPCTYHITTVSRTTGLVDGSPPYHKFKEENSNFASYILPRAPIQTYYFITARGLFGDEIFRSAKVYANPNFPTPPHPVSI
ncbi:MAG: GDSL family lipase, partial [Selenomonadaceae bacterium]|nr:GDSL family lipase [Selenomonadaceae bacterium]